MGALIRVVRLWIFVKRIETLFQDIYEPRIIGPRQWNEQLNFQQVTNHQKKRLLKQSQIKEKIALNQFHIRIQAFNWRFNRVFSLCPLHKDSPK